MDWTVIIISLVIGLAGTIFGGIYWSKFKTLNKQVLVLFNSFIAAIEDDQITREELDIMAKEAKKLYELFKEIKPKMKKK